MILLQLQNQIQITFLCFRMKRTLDGFQSLNLDYLQIKKTKFSTTESDANVTFPSGTYTVAKLSDIGVLPADIVRESTVQTLTNKDLSSSTNIFPSDIVRTTEDNAVNITNVDQSTNTTSGALVVAGGLGVDKNSHFGGTIHVPVGSQGHPTFSFITDPNTGIFQNGPDILGFTAGGSVRAVVGVNGLNSLFPITIPAGTTSTCAINFTGDSNTGLISGGSDQLSLVCGGGARFVLSGTSCTITPPIRGQTGTAALPAYSFSNDNTTGITLVTDPSPTQNSVAIVTAGAVRQSINATRSTFTVPIRLPNDGFNFSDLNYYEEFSLVVPMFYANFTSFNWVVNIIRIGKNVTYQFGDDATLFTIGNGPRSIFSNSVIPSRFRPGTNQVTPYLYLTGSLNWTMGKIIINSDGSLSISPQNSSFNTGDTIYIQRHSASILV